MSPKSSRYVARVRPCAWEVVRLIARQNRQNSVKPRMRGFLTLARSDLRDLDSPALLIAG